MAIEQRDVYMLPHPFDSRVEDHPFIVLSVREANEHETTFIAVMITGSEVYKNDFSFPLTDDMFIEKLRKPECHVRMHLLTLCLNEEIQLGGKKINQMKSQYFKELMKSIGDLIFNYDFSPLKDS